MGVEEVILEDLHLRLFLKLLALALGGESSMTVAAESLEKVSESGTEDLHCLSSGPMLRL